MDNLAQGDLNLVLGTHSAGWGYRASKTVTFVAKVDKIRSCNSLRNDYGSQASRNRSPRFLRQTWPLHVHVCLLLHCCFYLSLCRCGNYVPSESTLRTSQLLAVHVQPHRKGDTKEDDLVWWHNLEHQDHLPVRHCSIDCGKHGLLQPDWWRPSLRTSFNEKCRMGSHRRRITSDGLAFTLSTAGSSHITASNDGDGIFCHGSNKLLESVLPVCRKVSVSVFSVITSNLKTLNCCFKYELTHRKVPIKSLKDWEKVYIIYRSMKVYNNIVMNELKTMAVMIPFGSCCGVILTLYVTIRPHDLHILVYVCFPIVAIDVMVLVTWLVFDAVKAKGAANEVIENLRFGMNRHFMRYEGPYEKKLCACRLTSLRPVSLGIGDFSEASVNVPMNVWDEVFTQLVFLLSL